MRTHIVISISDEGRAVVSNLIACVDLPALVPLVLAADKELRKHYQVEHATTNRKD